jgi:signal peptidase I
MPLSITPLQPARELTARLTLVLMLVALLSAFVLHRYVFAVYIIEGTSMSPTFHDGDTALVNLLTQHFGPLDRGEIVLVRDGRFREYATKRIVGLPGERIEIRDNQVFIDGSVLREGYLPKKTSTTSERSTFTLGPSDYFVLGDNRAESYDSRIYGPVARNAIMGSYSRTFWACR